MSRYGSVVNRTNTTSAIWHNQSIRDKVSLAIATRSVQLAIIMKFLWYPNRVPSLEKRVRQLESELAHLKRQVESRIGLPDRLEELVNLLERRIKETHRQSGVADPTKCGRCGHVPVAITRRQAHGFLMTIRTCPACGAVASEAVTDATATPPNPGTAG